LHIRKSQWDLLSQSQKDAIVQASQASLVETYQKNNSVQCANLQTILDANTGLKQKEINGDDIAGTSAKMTLTKWGGEALNVINEASDNFLNSQMGSDTAAKQDFTAIYSAWANYRAVNAYGKFKPSKFPYDEEYPADATKCKISLD
jgi:TRAP-type mannitol/chloroaromatic compound transport system substrate-binding protein